MSVFDDALGVPYLPPSPVYPIDQLVAAGGAALPGNAALAGGLNVPVGAAATPAAPGPPLPIGPPAQTAAGGGTGVNLQQILSALEPQQQSGLSTPRFMSALGAGLSSAGQNWNKPAAAAFASGAGAAIQGGQSYDNQLQAAKLKALQTAIAAWKAGDLANYHRSLADYHKTVADEKRQRARPAAPPSEADGASADAAAVQPQVMLAHRAGLDRFLTDAEVPPQRLETADLDSAARLMAAKDMPAADAFEAASLHNAMDAGHVSPAEVDLIYGPGAADAIRSTAAS